jgi:hypothetical protein
LKFARFDNKHRAGGSRALAGGLLYSMHVFVGKPEMMPDFMHKNMSDDVAERVFMFRPKVEDRAAVEPDHVRKLTSHRSSLGLGAAAAAKHGPVLAAVPNQVPLPIAIDIESPDHAPAVNGCLPNSSVDRPPLPRDITRQALKGYPYGFASRFEGMPGTNPEELIAAAHAGCFTMALSLILGESKLTAELIPPS